jgi:hypothetical protein
MNFGNDIITTINTLMSPKNPCNKSDVCRVITPSNGSMSPENLYNVQGMKVDIIIYSYFSRYQRKYTQIENVNDLWINRYKSALL